MTAARHALDILVNTRHILAIEMYTAARALDLRLREKPDARMGIGTRRAYETLRNKVPYQAGDALWGPEIEQVAAMIREQAFS
jgi:histidine ammonia-lyase